MRPRKRSLAFAVLVVLFPTAAVAAETDRLTDDAPAGGDPPGGPDPFVDPIGDPSGSELDGPGVDLGLEDGAEVSPFASYPEHYACVGTCAYSLGAACAWSLRGVGASWVSLGTVTVPLAGAAVLSCGSFAASLALCNRFCDLVVR